MRAKNWAAMDLALQQKDSSSFPAFCVPNNTGSSSSSTSAAQFSNNIGKQIKEIIKLKNNSVSNFDTKIF